MRYFIKLAYKGTNYHGWQRQPNANSVQQELETALNTILQTEIETMGCGRTDTGVHASEFYLHFDINETIDCLLIKHKLNSFINKDIAINQILGVTEKAHARFDATERTYRYHINQSKNPFNSETSYYFGLPLNIALMNQACIVLLNHTDFTSFSKVKTDNFTNNCNISFAHWNETENQLTFTITANRFLRNMVRAIVGTLLEVGLQKVTVQEFENIILSKKRSNAGSSVPACGLFLTSVYYPKEIFI